MAMKISILVISMYIAIACQIKSPMTPAFGMGTGDALIYQGSSSSLSPFTPASWSLDSSVVSVAIGYTDFYGAMDNLTDERISLLSAGGTLGFKNVSIKTGLHIFNALDIYYEENMFVSSTITLFSSFRLGGTFFLNRSSIRSIERAQRWWGGADVSLMYSIKKLNFSLQYRNITFNNKKKRLYNKPQLIRFGVHTEKYSLGAQGVIIEMEPQKNKRFNVYLAEELHILPQLRCFVALGTVPLIVSTGAEFWWKKYNISASFTYNSLLGWTQNVTIMYQIKKKAKDHKAVSESSRI